MLQSCSYNLQFQISLQIQNKYSRNSSSQNLLDHLSKQDNTCLFRLFKSSLLFSSLVYFRSAIICNTEGFNLKKKILKRNRRNWFKAKNAGKRIKSQMLLKQLLFKPIICNSWAVQPWKFFTTTHYTSVNQAVLVDVWLHIV